MDAQTIVWNVDPIPTDDVSVIPNFDFFWGEVMLVVFCGFKSVTGNDLGCMIFLLRNNVQTHTLTYTHAPTLIS